MIDGCFAADCSCCSAEGGFLPEQGGGGGGEKVCITVCACIITIK